MESAKCFFWDQSFLLAWEILISKSLISKSVCDKQYKQGKSISKCSKNLHVVIGLAPILIACDWAEVKSLEIKNGVTQRWIQRGMKNCAL